MNRAVAWTARRLLKTLMSTVRYQSVGPQPHLQFINKGEHVIYTLWHGRLLPLAYYYKHKQIATMISRSQDGEHLRLILESWGYTSVRGSSSRGSGAALRDIVRVARKGTSLAMTPDGPRGPRQVLKRGVLMTAQLTGLPLIPISAGVSRAWWIEGWDRFLLPKPFSKAYVFYGEPVFVPRGASEAELDDLAQHVEHVLNELTKQADRYAERH